MTHSQSILRRFHRFFAPLHPGKKKKKSSGGGLGSSAVLSRLSACYDFFGLILKLITAFCSVTCQFRHTVHQHWVPHWDLPVSHGPKLKWASWHSRPLQSDLMIGAPYVRSCPTADLCGRWAPSWQSGAGARGRCECHLLCGLVIAAHLK